MRKSSDHGMQTFDQSLFDLLQEGAITIEEAMRNADSVNDLRLRIKLDASGEGAIDEMVANSMTLEEDEEDPQQGMMR